MPALPPALEFAPDALMLVGDVAALPFPGTDFVARHALRELSARALLWERAVPAADVERAIAMLE